MRKGSKLYLTDDDKIDILKEYDISKLDYVAVCKRWKISHTTFYKIKAEFWEIYNTTIKDNLTTKAIGPVTSFRVESAKKIAILERKAGTVLEKLLSIAEFKLDIEERRLKNELEEGEVVEKITMRDLTDFFKAAAPYFFHQLDSSKNKEETLTKRHLNITTILNQQIINNPKKNGNN